MAFLLLPSVLGSDKPSTEKPLFGPPKKPIVSNEPRTWTDKTGTKAVVATLLDRDGDHVQMRYADGCEFFTRLNNLSVKDCAYPIEPSCICLRRLQGMQSAEEVVRGVCSDADSC